MITEAGQVMAESSAMFQEGKRREAWGSYWDTYEAAQASSVPSEIRLFENKRSGSKGLEKTNMTKDGELPAGSEIDVDRIVFRFLNTDYADINLIQQNFGVTVLYGGIRVFEGLIDQAPGGGTEYSGAAATTQATTTIVRNVSRNGQNQGFSLQAPWLLFFTSGPKIEVILTTKATGLSYAATAAYGTGVFMRMYFEGLRRDLA